MGPFTQPNDPELYVLKNELECWDIDYEWQFNVAKYLYKNEKELWKK